MICSYHARANPAERDNRTIKPMIAIFTGDDHKAWDQHLNESQYAVNSVSSVSTKYSLAFLNLGRNPRPVLKFKGALETSPDPEYLTLESWANRLEKLPTLYNRVTQSMAEVNRKQAKYFNKNRREVTFNGKDKSLVEIM